MGKELIFSATKKDFKIDYFSGTGAGGQSRNKNQLCARITYIPWNMTAVSTKYKSQEQNRKAAFKVLADRIVKRVKKELAEKESPIKQDKTTIRTYHEKRGTCKDHRTGTTLPLNDVLDGKIDGFME